MEVKIYIGWAFSENELEKRDINRGIYQELKEKYRIYRHDTSFNPEINTEEFDVVIGRKPDYKHAKYNIIKNAPNLTTSELLLICDNGNLCFGGSSISKDVLRVSED